jgi:hypothetical protein
MHLSQKLTVQSSSAKHTLGLQYEDPSTGAVYVYCQDSGSGSSQYNPVTITPAFKTAALTKANADKNYLVGVPQIAVTASYYYWCMRKSAGVTSYVLAKSACVSEVLLFTTTTAGTLDDTGTSQTGIAGIQLTATAATAAASAVAACQIDYPKPFAAEVQLDVSDSKAESATLLAVSAQSSCVVSDSKAESATLLAVSAQSSCVVAGSKGDSAALVALSAQSSGASAASRGDSAAVLAVSAQSSCSVAQSGVTKFILACSTYADNAVANSHSNAVSVAVSADAGFGEFVSTLVSGISSAVAKNF